MHTTHARLILTLAALGTLEACSSPPVAAPQAPPSVAASTPTAAPRSAAQPAAAATPQSAATALAPHRDPTNALSRERVVYFAYDSDVIDAAGRAVIERHARYLVSNPTLTIKVEGHADERGSSEYNLALGQRRAEAARRALALLGVADARVEATSWGEERPVATGHDEAAWQRNRRGEIVYPPR